MIIALSWQRIAWKWRRSVAAKRMAAEYGEDVPLDIGYPRGWWMVFPRDSGSATLKSALGDLRTLAREEQARED